METKRVFSQRPVADAGDTLPWGRPTFIAINQNVERKTDILNVKQTSFKHPVIPLASSLTFLKQNITPSHPDVPGMSTCDQKRQTSYPPKHHPTYDATNMYKEIIRIHCAWASAIRRDTRDTHWNVGAWNQTRHTSYPQKSRWHVCTAIDTTRCYHRMQR